VPVLGGHAVVDASGGPADLATDIVRRRVVEDAMASLRPQARAILVLRHYYGYDYAQIGTFLGLPGGTVGTTLSRAHAELRRRLTPEPLGDVDPPMPAAISTAGAIASHPIERPKPPEVLP